MKNERCVLLSSANIPLAQGIVQQESGDLYQVKILDDKAPEVEQHEIIHLMGESGERPLQLQCHLTRCRGDIAILEKMSELDPEYRRNFRIPVRFDSFVYPISGSWRGRRNIQSIDLSCGGVAFYASSGMEIDEVAEVVIPTKVNPIIVKLQILRKKDLKDKKTYYASKFVDLQPEEDRLICEQVFSIQISNRAKSGDSEKMEEIV